MKLLRLLRRRKPASRNQPPVSVEAARRALRAREHLARKRRHGERPAGSPAPFDLDAGEAPRIEARPATERSAPRASGRDRASARQPELLSATPIAARPRTPVTARGGRSASPRKSLPARPLPRFAVPLALLGSLAAGHLLSGPLLESRLLPRTPLARVAISGDGIRTARSIAATLLPQAGAPLDRFGADRVEALVTRDAWIESVRSLRLPNGTLLVEVVERRAIARHRNSDEAELSLLDPTGRSFAGAIEAGGPLPLVEGPLAADEAIPETALEILAEVRQHPAIAGRDPSALILHLPDARRTDGAEDTAGYVLELGRGGPTALLGETFLKRRIARLAALLERRDAILAAARVIDLRYADRAVLQSEPTSG